MYIYIYIYITHTHTYVHIHIYIYTYIHTFIMLIIITIESTLLNCLMIAGGWSFDAAHPHRAQLSQCELFELVLLSRLDYRFPAEQVEAAVSQSTGPSPPLSLWKRPGRAGGQAGVQSFGQLGGQSFGRPIYNNNIRI